MTTAKNKEVLATTRVSEWFEDFLTALKGLLPVWVEAYGINKDPLVESDSLDYRTVAKVRMARAKIAKSEDSQERR
jgi:hypothetical protein